MLTAPTSTVRRARQLRSAMTLPEVLLWQALRARPDGLKFRRQHPFGCYVLDFFCVSAKLAIEVDGMAHDMGKNPARDERRDAYLNQNGIAVLRFAATDVLKGAGAVVTSIVATASPRTPPPCKSMVPLPESGEEFKDRSWNP